MQMISYLVFLGEIEGVDICAINLHLWPARDSKADGPVGVCLSLEAT